MRTHRVRALAAGAAVGLCLGAGIPAAAGAAEGCDALVGDGAGVLHDVPAIERSAAELYTALGARVRMRTLGTVPGGDLDAGERRLEAECPDWQRADGMRRDDLLVVVVGPADHKTGIYYGRSLQRRLDPVYERVQRDAMNPRFKDGDFDGGITAGLVALRTPPAPSPVDELTQKAARYAAESPERTVWLLVGASAVLTVLGGIRGRVRRRYGRARRRRGYATDGYDYDYGSSSGYDGGGGGSDGGGGSTDW